MSNSLKLSHREVLAADLTTASLSAGSLAWAQGSAGTLRIGYQKSASLFVLLKAQGTLEKKLSTLGFAPKGVEGLNVGSVDVGFVGEAPPIFAQAAGAKFVYIGFDPAAPQAHGCRIKSGMTAVRFF